MYSPTEKIANFISGIKVRDIPSEAFDVAKRCFVDCLGVTLAGSGQPEAAIVTGMARELGGNPQAGVIASCFKTSVTLAALANGTMAHALDYDDISTKFLAHPSVSLIPAILALGESRRASGKDMLLAYIIGYEVGASLGHIMGMNYFSQGWHPSSPLGTIGAAAAVARLLGLGDLETRRTLGIAASLAGGLKANFGTMTKPFHMGYAAQNAIIAGTLASRRFTANESIIEHEMGFCRMFTNGPCDFTDIEKTLGKIWFILTPGIQFKLYPCCGAGIACIDAVLELKKRHHLHSADIEEVGCRLSAITSSVMIHKPKTGQEARFSLEFSAAVALIDGELSLRQFTDERVNDPVVQDLMNKVTIQHPKEMSSEIGLPQKVIIKLKGERHFSKEVTNPKGDPGNPLTDDELLSKFKGCASIALTPETVERVQDHLWNLDRLSDVAELMKLLTFKGAI